MTVTATSEQLRQFAEQGPDGPIHMLNLLRFRERAEYSADSQHSPCSGAEAYDRYGQQMLPILKQAGARIVTLAACHAPLIGEARDAFDHMVIVRYPSRQAMLEMLASEAYQAVAVHRTAAVEHSLLIPMSGLELLTEDAGSPAP